ncbi:MAG: phytoene/squalene synthase family protein [Flavobacteriales bacterium]|nr:phytoene/squalene synthase family protein [Flavobacteriales bacterium]MCB9448563.1 phytoene/squalene synthase family protein [Flavobacteriales bacterium]
MRNLYDQIAAQASRQTTRLYSTSFSLGIFLLNRRLHQPIYAIYGFVRFADEIVDTFHDQDQAHLLEQFRKDTDDAISRRFSMNPILHSFQQAVHRYGIGRDLIDTFMNSMKMDLDMQQFDAGHYKQYILGSAEVVGLMCLRVFCNGNDTAYEQLKPYAMRLGSAFQKINFLRDLRADYELLGRNYFPDVDVSQLTDADKRMIEQEIERDFRQAAIGIRLLPRTARFGVYVAYMYYYQLFRKIRKVPAKRVLRERIRISNHRKYGILLQSYFRHSLNLL